MNHFTDDKLKKNKLEVKRKLNFFRCFFETNDDYKLIPLKSTLEKLDQLLEFDIIDDIDHNTSYLKHLIDVSEDLLFLNSCGEKEVINTHLEYLILYIYNRICIISEILKGCTKGYLSKIDPKKKFK